MPRPKPWLKMWVEWLGDPKIDSLSLAQQGAWWRLVSLAHQCADDGALTVGGTPLSTEEIMKTLKITDEADRQVFLTMIEKMKARGSLHWNSNTLVVTHYKDRQEMVPSNFPEAVLARQHKHRQKGLAAENASPLNKPPNKRTEGDKETEGEGEKRRDVTAEMSQKGRDSILAELSRLYEQYIGLLTPPAGDQLREFAEHYEGDIKWIQKAFDASGSKRRWPYVAAILERYQEEGGPGERTDKGRRAGTPQRPAPQAGRKRPLREITGGE